MDNVNMSIGEVLKERRIELVIKQEDLAEQMDVTVQTVSKWERGITEPKATQVAKLAKALKLTEREICQGKKDQMTQLDPFEFMKLVGPCMKGISETEVIMTMYDYVDDKQGFINSLAEQSSRPLFSFKERDKSQARDMLALYESGSISFNNEQEEQRCLEVWKRTLSE
ncbi:helix-turn-helix domain-containing protein [Vibrio parahaemolyticus]|uniref:helix-turn-helix domain-containing protein n=1 Tax=Vibrio parahaemolyticus TaxID=670 RepID=UPI00084B75FF|nr:helix-turn-helix transcriptional regulator [Vibrio parahaemolyticus]EHU5192614.1 helix-turn-helix transcriptional regulator [Vibrio parahaemolyticus]ODY53760.1 transcriptional regulator [Vibrio parahaemolyticus]ODY57934.1 transcriptional regulator [Vibrio parahaemolyticus]ODY69694.1 transcriptional regulator [Vibrio parahaemolyticus]